MKCIEDEIPFDIPGSWAWARTKTVSVDLPYGTSKKSNSSGKVAVLRMGNLQDGEIDYSNLVYSSDEADIEKYYLLENDLLFNRTNSAEWVGKTSIYRGDTPAIYAGYLIRIRTPLCGEYLNAVMNSVYAKNYCIRVKTDAVNQSNINAQKLGTFLVPVAPIKEQHRIVTSFKRTFEFTQCIQSGKKELSALIQSAKAKILDLAIRGQLVPQDPADEPASVLLDRIRTEKEELIRQGKIKRDKKESVIFRGEDNSYYLRTGELVESLEDWDFEELPDSWSVCCLGELCDYGNCTNIDTADIADSAWILDLEDIEKDSGVVLQKVRQGERNAGSTKHRFHKGQVLYSKLRPYLNKVVLADEDGYCTSEILPLEFERNILPQYARYFLMSPAFLRYANKCSYGVKMPRLGTADGKKAIISVPPVKEQKRIIMAIELAFAQLASIAENLA